MDFARSEGLIAATFTPFHPNEKLNLSIIPHYAAILKSNGISGVFVCGTSGEGVLMNVEDLNTPVWI